jgi:hypothetical protein
MMSYTTLRSAAMLSVITAAFLLLTAGCNDRHHKESGGGVQSADKHALFDRDSRNNEDNTLGVKSTGDDGALGRPKADNPGAFKGWDFNNQHAAKTFRFAPEIARQLEQTHGIQNAIVMITESNAYVGVVPYGHDPDKEADPDIMSQQFTSAGGVGLFGSDKGNARINWTLPGGLNHAMSLKIKDQVLSMTQPVVDKVFVSANPNFVGRLRFYAKEEQKAVDLSAYMNEFRTLVQRVFPNNSNGGGG